MKKLILFSVIVFLNWGVIPGNTPQPNTAQIKANGPGFVENKGQIVGFDGRKQSEVKFVFQDQGMQIFLLEDGLAYQFTKVHYPENYDQLITSKKPEDVSQLRKLNENIRIETYRMDLKLKGISDHVQIRSENPHSDKINYYNHQVFDVHQYDKIVYQNVYPNIDWVVYTKDNTIKYDFLVRPGGDPSNIIMEFTHQEGQELNKDGSFTLKSAMGDIKDEAPRSWQDNREITSNFRLTGNRLSFHLGDYDPTLTLTIDPVVLWATYYGGSASEPSQFTTTDALGNVYLAGYTRGSNGLASGGHQNTYAGGYNDAYLVKFNSSGVRQWATYYGGAGDEYAYGCATDASNNVYLVGTTSSSVGIASGGHQNTTNNNLWNPFLVKFNGSGVRQWATYYNGNISCSTEGWGCVCDGLGNVYLTGYTNSTNGIASGGHQNTIGGIFNDVDAYLVKFNSSGTRQWGTYYGGTNSDYGMSVAADSNGNIILFGQTSSTASIASGGHQNNFGGNTADAYVVKFNTNGIRQWGTYYGGTARDYPMSCAMDVSGNIFVAGITESTNAISSGGHQNTFAGGNTDAFLVKFNSIGVRQWATYYGGTGSDFGFCCAVNTAGDVFMVGYTTSSNNIASPGYQSTYTNNQNAFMVKFNGLGTRQWGTYFGPGGESATSCALSPGGDLYLAGETVSTANLASGGFQNTFGGDTDGFLVKFCEQPAPSAISGSTVFCPGSVQLYSVTAINGVSNFSWTTPGGWSGSSTTNSISLTINSSGTLSVVVTNTCGTSFAQTLQVLSTTVPTITVNSGTVCDNAIFTMTPTGALTYTFSNGASTVIPTGNTSYSVIGTSSAGCLSSNTAIASVTVFPLPAISISASSQTICLGETITMVAQGGQNYLWNTTSTNDTIFVSPSQTSVFTVTGTDTTGCINTATLNIIVGTCVGTRDEFSRNETSIYPNPCHKDFFIQVTKAGAITMLNSVGQIIQTHALVSGLNHFTISSEMEGVYQLVLVSSEGYKVYKLVVVH